MPPAAKALIPFGFGILLGVELSPPPILSFLASLLCLSLGFSLYLRRRRVADPFLLSLFLFGGMAIGVISLTSPRIEPLFGREVRFEGEVIRSDVRRYGMLIYSAGRIRNGPKARLLIRWGNKIPLRRGDRLEAIGRLRAPQPSRNPGSFNWRRYLAAQGIHAELRAKGIRRLSSRGFSLRRSAEGVRIKLESLLFKLLPEREALLVSGMILGDREIMPDEMEESFRRSGLSHLLAVSGLHVGMLSSFCFLLLRLIRLPRRIASAVTILIVACYALIVGLRPSVVRTSIIVTLALVGYMIDRDVNLMNLLAVAGMGMLAFRPQVLWDVGFQFTFVVTASILYLMPRWDRLWMKIGEGWRRRWPILYLHRLILLPFTVALSAQIGSIPITAYHFHQLHPWGLIPNIGAVWLLWAVVGLTLMALALASIWLPLAYPFGAVDWLALSALERLTIWASSLKRATLFISKPQLWQILSYGFLAVATANLGDVRRNAGRWLLLAASILTLSIWHLALTWPGRVTEVTFLDVGYGSAAFIRTADGKTALINAGPLRGGFNSGQAIIEPFLRYKGVKRLNLVAVTEEKSTLMGGLRHLRGRFKIDRLILPGESGRWNQVKLGDVCQVRIWSPPPGKRLALRLRYGRIAFLFAGSLEIEDQKLLMKEGAELKAQVIEVPRHGSRRGFDPTFLGYVAPVMGVIPVGINPFHLPSRDVLEGYGRMGIRISRTDEDGALTILTDGRLGWVFPYLPHK